MNEQASKQEQLVICCQYAEICILPSLLSLALPGCQFKFLYTSADGAPQDVALGKSPER